MWTLLNKARRMNRFASRLVWLIAAAGLVAAAGCGGDGGASPSAADLDKAFAANSKTGAVAGAAMQPHAAAAVLALKAKDYPKAMAELEALRTQSGLTPDQYMTLNKVSGDVVQKLATLADKGDAQAKAALERLKQERDRR